jgi:hypothetical protein
VAPLLMTWIIAETASTAGVSLYLAAMAVVTMYCAWRLPETNTEAVRNDPVAVPGLSAAA